VIQGVVFDFDGTLVDSNRLKRDGYAAAVADDPMGAQIMAQALARTRGDRYAVFADYVALRGRSDLSASVLAQRYTASVDAAVAQAREMQGAMRLLERLRSAGRTSFVSSATPADSLARIVAARGWAHFFAALYGAPARKSDTLRALMAEHGWRAEEVAVVGDGADDRDAADAVGCRFFPVGDYAGGGKIHRLDEIAACIGLADTPGTDGK